MWRLNIRLPFLNEMKVSSISWYLQMYLPMHLLEGQTEWQISVEELVGVQPHDVRDTLIFPKLTKR